MVEDTNLKVIEFIENITIIEELVYKNENISILIMYETVWRHYLISKMKEMKRNVSWFYI